MSSSFISPTRSIRIRAFGIPAPQGSKRYVGNGYMKESSQKVQPWRESVRVASSKSYEGNPIEMPVSIAAHFVFPRPKSHYRTGKFAGLLKPDAPQYSTSHSNGDLDKLLRSTFDGLSFSCGGSVLKDDSLVVSVEASKRYSASDEPPGAFIYVRLA
mgnify:FL=1